MIASEQAAGVAAAARLLAPLGERVHRDHPLAPMTTYRVGGPARFFVDAAGVDDLAVVAAAHRASGLPLLVVGRGSNMLVADDGFPGIALSIAGVDDRLDIPAGVGGGEEAIVTVGGGVSLPVAARRTAAAALTGFEWAVGVPGSIGGAVRMNAGGHGSDMAASLVDVDLVDLGAEEPGVERRPLAALGLGVRSSALGATEVVISARLRLRGGDREAAERTLTEIVQWRREHQPGGHNCGSVFVNPVPGEVAAGALIDAAGMRGLRIGTASVSDKHANFIQSDEGGTAADVRAVMETVRARIADTTGYLLRTEVRLVGFDDVDPNSFDDPRPIDEAGR